ncbi:MAG TPA: 2-amino-4-hydroxy-6-hydroxymethyldihydropteridine diphosphokinase [Casimicrobiaceae bacterium]|nr:2-amino-4-hydroxy-6-hydroxymethyldihydropteridine diphosphokinase [Casimicrobiaceae bacterium]
MPSHAFIGLGSNLAHPRRQLAKALARLDAIDGVRLVAVSPSYVTAPIGGLAQPDFVNAVALVETTLPPHALLARMQAIERRQQRRRDVATPPNAPRTLDLDLLLYGARRMRSAQLTVPHPRMHERAFVLRPLTDIAPVVRIPGRGPARRFLPGVRAQRIQRTRTHRTLT